MPNDRLIRWYVTVGLVDPPLSRSGRVARYGRRHLLQLVAVKRRQAEGRSLADIQAELVGATSAYLESVADVPANGSGEASLPTGSGPDGSDRRFWTRDLPPPAPGSAAPVSAAPVPPALEPPAPIAAGVVQGIRLAPGVVVVLDADGPALQHSDLAALRLAAAPLIQALARLGYCDGPIDEERKRP
jgi:MerR HTH family regulatory protein